MAVDLSEARYSAVQIGEQLVVMAERDVGDPGDILFFQERPSEDKVPEFAILKNRISVAPDSLSSGSFAFKGLMTQQPISHVRIYEKGGGFQTIPVAHQQAEATGSKLTLPLIDLSSPLAEAVHAMKENDARAVVVRTPQNDFRLVTNYDVAKAYENDLTLEDIYEEGHAVTSWRDAIPEKRDRLFSMVRPGNERLIDVTSLFEVIANGVTQGAKICRCTSNLKNHTVMDQNPSLEGKPCVKPTSGHGTYECF
jgi:hypothetical protein